MDLKFKQWDKLGKLNLSNNDFKAKAAWLWRDPTMWSYATLLDKQNKPLRCYDFQDRVMNDRHRFNHCSAANQIGKTWSMILKGAHHALHVNNASVMLISRSETQAKGILDEIKWMFKRGRIDFTQYEDEITNRLEYHLKSPDGKGTSVIRVFPPTPAILSFPSTLTIMDETGFWEEKNITMAPIAYYQQCVEPRTNATKYWKHPFLTMGQIVSITNPNGQNGLAWWLYNNKKFHNYRYSWLANPNNELADYNTAKEELPPIRFASVYAAEYLSASGGFITLDQYERFRTYNVPLAIPPGVLYLGGDWASEEPKSKNTDWTVFYGVMQVPNPVYKNNPRIAVVYYKEFPPGTTRESQYNEISRLKNLPGVTLAKFGYDKPGVGDAVKNDLINRGVLTTQQIEPLTYSLPNKSEVYLNFQALFLQDMIEGSDIQKLREQLLALRVEQPVGSIHIKVHHKTEGVKDDHPDALANACYMAKLFNSFNHCSLITGGSASKIGDSAFERQQMANDNFIELVKENSTENFF